MRIVKFMLGGLVGGFVAGGAYTSLTGGLDLLDMTTFGAGFAGAVGGMVGGLVAGAVYGAISRPHSQSDGADD